MNGQTTSISSLKATTATREPVGITFRNVPTASFKAPIRSSSSMLRLWSTTRTTVVGSSLLRGRRLELEDLDRLLVLGDAEVLPRRVEQRRPVGPLDLEIERDLREARLVDLPDR